VRQTVVRVVVVVELDPADRGMDAGVGAGHHGEPDVAGAAAVNEPVSAAGRVGPDLNRPADRVRVVTATVTDCDLDRELGDRRVEDAEVIGDCVRAGVARAQHRRECLTGRVGETQQRVISEPALVGRAGALLVLRVDLDQ